MIMIDIETVGLRPGSFIPTIGYCHFDWTGVKDSGTIAIKLENWTAAKSDISTVKFWLQQGQEAIAKTFFRDEKLQIDWVRALSLLAEKIRFNQKEFGEGVWANGPLFDLAHLEYWYDQMSEKPPYSHREPRDCRTFFDTVARITGWDRDAATTYLKARYPDLTTHDAEQDAILQALLVIDANDALTGLKRRAEATQYPRDAIDAG